jgi:calcineurin-like phosphoesterase family protein
MPDFFISDTHFGHHNVIRYCNRPFASVEEMNRVMAERWNAVVGQYDRVFHLGDFSMGPKILRPNYLAALSGYKILIRGNHDAPAEVMLKAGFNEVHESFVYDDKIHEPRLLVHIPLGIIGKALCGHVHQAWVRHSDEKRDIINVGVDVWNFYPHTLDALLGAKPDQPEAVCR